MTSRCTTKPGPRRPQAAACRAWPKDTLVDLLQQVTGLLDALWDQAVRDGQGDAAMGLGDASLGAHRALIALGGSDWQLTPPPGGHRGRS
jgi:hypothetical protein